MQQKNLFLGLLILSFFFSIVCAPETQTKKVVPMASKGFASDNYAGIHPNILQAINDANSGAIPKHMATIPIPKRQ